MACLFAIKFHFHLFTLNTVQPASTAPTLLRHRLFDPFSLGPHLGIASKIQVNWGHIVQRLVVTAVVAVLHEAGDSCFQRGWRVIAFCICDGASEVHRMVIGRRVIRQDGG